MEDTGLALIQKNHKGETVCEALNECARMSNAWGLPLPPCPNGCQWANMEASFPKPSKNFEKRFNLLPVTFRCKSCQARSKKIPPPESVRRVGKHAPTLTWTPFPPPPLPVKWDNEDEPMEQGE